MIWCTRTFATSRANSRRNPRKTAHAVSMTALSVSALAFVDAPSARAEEAPAFRETLLEGCAATVRAPDFPEVGQLIPCEIRFTARAESAAQYDPKSLFIPTRPETLGVFDVLSLSAPRIEVGANGITYTIIDVVLSTLDSGTQTPEPLTVAYIAGGTLREGRVEFPSFPVKSLIGEELDPTKYRDILGEISIAQRVAWWGYAGAAAILVVGAWLIWRLLRHDRRDALAADAWARAEFDRLARANYPERGEFGPFYDALTAIVRGYVRRRYEIPADRQTTREFLAATSAHPEFPTSETEQLRGLLQLADLVKFAQARPEAASCAAHFTEARAFVERTRPISSGQATNTPTPRGKEAST